MEDKTAVDIVIPIYNGYEDLKRCIPSVIQQTDLSKHRLIMIDDCSPDERIAPYLDSFAGEQNVTVLHNEKNLGFSGNVNIGFSMSEDRDVILLNADTIVTGKWVEKLAACAARDPWIGTVTPLSNSATLCSVPIFCRDNEIPDGFTVDSYAALVERCSLHRYPRITVSVGFCMYVKRRLIREIGGFDAETFGRGYGEENDFCNRAEQAGYYQVMCDDTFIYHKGTASFDTEEKQALLKEHEAVLEERYPEQMQKNRVYCQENPDQEIRDNLILHTKLNNGKKNLFYLLHLDFSEEAMHNVGGTQMHVRELTEYLRSDYNIFVAARDGQFLNVRAYTDQDSVLLRFEIGEAPDYPTTGDARLRTIYEQILRAFSIDLVHVHHTQDVSLEIFGAAKELGIPVIATIHDYYAACPTILLLDEHGQFCRPLLENMTEEEQAEHCRECLRQKKSIYPGTDFLKLWRDRYREALESCRELIFPSESARDIFLGIYPELAEKAVVIAHGEDRPECGELQRGSIEKAGRSAELKIRLDSVNESGPDMNHINGWAYQQGLSSADTEIYVRVTDAAGNSETILAPREPRPDIVDAFGDPDARMSGFNLRLHSEVLRDGPIRIEVFVKNQGQFYTDGQVFKSEYHRRFGKGGRLNVAFLGGVVWQKGADAAREMIRREKEKINWFVFGEIGDEGMKEIHQDNCFFSARYKKEELPALFADNAIDLVCILPIWPETFSYTVSEAWMNGIPIVGTDIGAVGERIRETDGGWLVPVGEDPDKILELLYHIQQNPGEYQKKKENVQKINQKTVKEMCEEYRSLYDRLMKENTDESRETIRDTADYEFIFQALALGDPSVGGRGAAGERNRLKNENMALRASIEVMQGTTSYRLAKKISEINIPFKEEVKKAARRLSKKQ